MLSNIYTVPEQFGSVQVFNLFTRGGTLFSPEQNVIGTKTEPVKLHVYTVPVQRQNVTADLHGSTLSHAICLRPVYDTSCFL